MNLGSETKVSVSHGASQLALDPSAELLINMLIAFGCWKAFHSRNTPAPSTGSLVTKQAHLSPPSLCVVSAAWIYIGKETLHVYVSNLLPKPACCASRSQINSPFSYTILIYLPCSTFTSNAKKYKDDIIWFKTSTKTITTSRKIHNWALMFTNHKKIRIANG